MFRKFHCQFVVGDKNKLHCLRHLPHQVTVPRYVGIIKWRVDFVEHAERGGVEIKKCKHERDCRKRFFTTGQQIDIADAFAGWPRHYGNTRAEQVVSSHHQIGVTAPEQAREVALQHGIYLFERLLESGTRFTVNFFNRGFQCFQRFGHIGELSVEVLLAGFLFGVFVNRRQIDRAKPLNTGFDRFKVFSPYRDAGISGQFLQ